MTIQYKPEAGTHIGEAVRVASRMAKKAGQPVSFKFNDIEVVAQPDSTPQSLNDYWQSESDRQAEEYRQSPEYEAHQEYRAQQIIEKQAIVDRLVAAIPARCNLHKAMDWAYVLAENAGDVGVTLDTKDLASRLRSLGWVKNAHCLKDSAGQAAIAKNRLAIETSAKMMAEYIMGQVISCLDSRMPPHQVTMRFVEDYRKLVASEGQAVTQLPEPMSPQEIDAKSYECFDAVLQYPIFVNVLRKNNVPIWLAKNLHRLGFMDGSIASTERIQQFVDAGGNLRAKP